MPPVLKSAAMPDVSSAKQDVSDKGNLVEVTQYKWLDRMILWKADVLIVAFFVNHPTHIDGKMERSWLDVLLEAAERSDTITMVSQPVKQGGQIGGPQAYRGQIGDPSLTKPWQIIIGTTFGQPWNTMLKVTYDQYLGLWKPSPTFSNLQRPISNWNSFPSRQVSCQVHFQYMRLCFQESNAM